MTKTMEHLYWVELGITSSDIRFKEIAKAVRTHGLCDVETETEIHAIFRDTLKLYTKINDLHRSMTENGLIQN